MPQFNIDEIALGTELPPVVVVELGINHGGSLEVAKKQVDTALQSGARLIKHQTHIPDAEMSKEALYVKPGNADKSIYEVISSNTLCENDEFELLNYVRKQGGTFFSTPFSREAFFRLRSWDVPAYKIGSGECGNFPLVELIASDRKPVIMSTGMNNLKTIGTSVEILRNYKVPFALMHTTNLYPTPAKLIRLGGIDDLRRNFPDAVIGLSDHSTSNAACIASISHGARILERHFTDSKDRVGPDISCSMDPEDLRRLIQESSDAYLAEGGGRYPASEEEVTIKFAFASVVSTRNINPGELLSLENIWVKRPSGGDFGPADLSILIGRTVQRTIFSNTQISKEDLVDS
jgi:N-acetylneuraminate synthase